MLHITITEYTTSLGDVTEKKKAYIKINEFDVGGSISSKITAKGSLLIGNGAGSLVEFPAGLNGQVFSYDNSTPTGGKAVTLTTPEGEMTNRSGVNMAAGTVCVLHSTANSITTTTIANDRRVHCITAEAINDLDTGNVIYYGKTTVLVTGAVVVGQWLVSSTSAGRAKASGYTKPIGAIGIALSANVSGDGSVDCALAIDWYLTISAGKGYLQGNYAASTLNQILSFITETTSGGAALPGNLSYSSGLASPTTGYIINGAGYKTPFSTDTPAAAAAASLPGTVTNMPSSGVSNATKGFTAGSNSSALAYKLTFASESTAAVATANLTASRYMPFGLTDTNNGYFIGGFAAAVSAIGDKLSLAAETTSAVVGTNLTTARYGSCSVSNIGVAGYSCGGFVAAKSALVDKTVFASDTTSASNSLATAIACGGGLSGANAGYSCGGANLQTSATGITTTVESMAYASETWAAVAGAALPTAQASQAAMSTLN